MAFGCPPSIAPFDVILSPLSASDELLDGAVEMGAELERAGFEVLLDDRDERPGVKFKDADLVGVPYRITMGSKKFAEGKVEVLVRGTKQKEDVAISAVVEHVKKLAEHRTSRSRRLPQHQMYSVIIHCMADSNILTLRVDSKLKKKLDKLAKTTQRSRSFLAAEAIREYVALNEWQVEEIKRAIQQADAGDFATDEEVEEMFRKLAKRAR